MIKQLILTFIICFLLGVLLHLFVQLLAHIAVGIPYNPDFDKAIFAGVFISTLCTATDIWVRN